MPDPIKAKCSKCGKELILTADKAVACCGQSYLYHPNTGRSANHEWRRIVRANKRRERPVRMIEKKTQPVSSAE